MFLNNRRVTQMMAAMLTCAAATCASAQTMPVDPILDESASMLAIGFTPTRDGLATLATLRGEHDKAVVPFFERVLARNEKETSYFCTIAIPVISKDGKKLDIDKVLNPPQTGLLGPALALLLDTDCLSNEQLVAIQKQCADSGQKALIATALAKRNALPHREDLVELATTRDKDLVRMQAAVTMIETGDEAEIKQALEILTQISARQDPRLAPYHGLMLTRIGRDNIHKAIPWVQYLADNADDDALRRAAVSTMLNLHAPGAPAAFGKLLEQQKQTIQQVKLGLIAIQFGPQLKAEQILPLEKSKVSLVSAIGKIARQSTEGNSSKEDLLKLMAQGHPIILDWALNYSDAVDADLCTAIRDVIIQQATILDQQRGRDYERAVVAAERMTETNTPADRAQLAKYLKADNMAVIEATLAGMAHSQSRDVADVVLPNWPTLKKKSSLEQACNYAAIVLARENHAEAKSWLADMVQGATIKNGNVSLRALAGWYYAKLTGQTEALIALAEKKADQQKTGK